MPFKHRKTISLDRLPQSHQEWLAAKVERAFGGNFSAFVTEAIRRWAEDEKFASAESLPLLQVARAVKSLGITTDREGNIVVPARAVATLREVSLLLE